MQGLHSFWKMQDSSCDQNKALWERILFSRGVENEKIKEFFHPGFDQINGPESLPGANFAAKVLVELIRKKEPILIYGDYDVDGISGTSILVRLIRILDPDVTVDWFIPTRSGEGYGLHVNRLEEIAKRGFKAVVTVDCGVNSYVESKHAEKLGLTLIITDHHLLESERKFSKKTILVHPHLDNFESDPICGAAVAWKLAWEIARVWKNSEQVGQRLQRFLLDSLAVAGIATIADVMPLRGENRSIVSIALRHFHRISWRGVRALQVKAKVGLGETPITSRDIAFSFAPLINAIGRLGNASDAVELFVIDDECRIEKLAEKMYKLNNKRRSLQKELILDAEKLAMDLSMLDESSRAIVIQNDCWNPGLLGIAAGRMAEKYNKPVFIATLDEQKIVGSARGIKGASVYSLLKSQAHLLIKFGGHEKAGGFSLSPDNYENFCKGIRSHAESMFHNALLREIHVDCEASLDEINAVNLNAIEKMAPFGEENKEPIVLISGSFPKNISIMGRSNNHLKFYITKENVRFDVVWFNGSSYREEMIEGRKFQAVGFPMWNRYKGRAIPQFQVLDLRFCDDT